MRAIFTDKFISKNALKQIGHNLFLRSTFNETFYAIHEHIEKFVNILLNVQIYWAAIIVFKSSTELFGIEILFFHFHESAEYTFHLVQNIIFDWLFV